MGWISGRCFGERAPWKQFSVSSATFSVGTTILYYFQNCALAHATGAVRLLSQLCNRGSIYRPPRREVHPFIPLLPVLPLPSENMQTRISAVGSLIMNNNQHQRYRDPQKPWKKHEILNNEINVAHFPGKHSTMHNLPSSLVSYTIVETKRSQVKVKILFVIPHRNEHPPLAVKLVGPKHGVFSPRWSYSSSVHQLIKKGLTEQKSAYQPCENHHDSTWADLARAKKRYFFCFHVRQIGADLNFAKAHHCVLGEGDDGWDYSQFRRSFCSRPGTTKGQELLSTIFNSIDSRASQYIPCTSSKYTSWVKPSAGATFSPWWNCTEGWSHLARLDFSWSHEGSVDLQPFLLHPKLDSEGREHWRWTILRTFVWQTLNSCPVLRSLPNALVSLLSHPRPCVCAIDPHNIVASPDSGDPISSNKIQHREAERCLNCLQHAPFQFSAQSHGLHPNHVSMQSCCVFFCPGSVFVWEPPVRSWKCNNSVLPYIMMRWPQHSCSLYQCWGMRQNTRKNFLIFRRVLAFGADDESAYSVCEV